MEFIRGIHNLKSYHRGCALAIGNFDGFHCGHQALILKLKEVGYNRGLPIMVMIFEPQPREYFLDVSVRLSSLRDKIRYLSDFGVDVLLCVLFNLKIALLKPYSFVTDILVRKLDTRVICVGDNFRFGMSKRGDFHFLEEMSDRFKFKVIKVDTCFDNTGCRISSTVIRDVLKDDRLEVAEVLLGHTYSVSGRVVYGMQLGGIIGFPTLNILFKGQQLPINGVYAVEVYVVSCNQLMLGIANIGISPTVRRFCKQQRFEVHVLDRTVNLYGGYVRVIVRAKIRNEQYFSSLKLLQDQIKNDIIGVKKYFNKY